MIETRNGSDQTLKQHVWGITYVDELLQIGINQDPNNANTGNTENECERFFWACQDANFNVIGILSANGDLIERYEYTPYGQRTVYSRGWLLADANDDGVVNMWDGTIIQDDWGTGKPASRGDLDGDGDCDPDDGTIYDNAQGSAIADDDLVTHPRLESFRSPEALTGAGTTSICDIGHQGLMHDKEFGLIYNRARYLHPTLGRFLQRDPLRYADGMSLYEYVRSAPVTGLDPLGEDPTNIAMAAAAHQRSVRAANEQWLRDNPVRTLSDAKRWIAGWELEKSRLLERKRVNPSSDWSALRRVNRNLEYWKEESSDMCDYPGDTSGRILDIGVGTELVSPKGVEENVNVVTSYIALSSLASLSAGKPGVRWAELYWEGVYDGGGGTYLQNYASIMAQYVKTAKVIVKHYQRPWILIECYRCECVTKRSAGRRLKWLARRRPRWYRLTIKGDPYGGLRTANATALATAVTNKVAQVCSGENLDNLMNDPDRAEELLRAFRKRVPK